jgi:hypothetical protein
MLTKCLASQAWGDAEALGRYFPNARSVGFVDGIGWYVRQGDLKRMVRAFDDIFTFQEQELERFVVSVKSDL